MTETTAQGTPLQAFHLRNGARMGEFAGHSLPIRYEAGIIAEHQAVRERAGLFDVSHMGQILVEGPDAARLIARLAPVDSAGMKQGRCRYGLLLNDAAGILDDFIVTRLSDTRFLAVVNAANAAADLALFEAEAEGLRARVERLPRAMIAVQGPDSRRILSERFGAAGTLSFMTAAELENGWFLSATGYTGEHGFEIALDAESAEGFAESLRLDGPVQLAGLGARDSLRLEAGLCLHGQDISEDTTPWEAGLGWAVSRKSLEAGGFRGDAALRQAAANPLARRLMGLLPEGRAPVRSGTRLCADDGRRIGTVTSGGYSPTRSRPVAMGYIDAKFAVEGTAVDAEVRGRRVPCEVAARPFVPHNYWRAGRK